MSNAYPFLSPNPNTNNINNRQWIISNRKTSNDDNNNLQRDQRGTGFYIIRRGDYLIFVPDSRHHFWKNMRPYIGRRR
jgi:hypothetical protein